MLMLWSLCPTQAQEKLLRPGAQDGWAGGCTGVWDQTGESWWRGGSQGTRALLLDSPGR